MRVIDTQTNLWGRTQGIEPQRSDLWVVDFQEVMDGLNKNVLNRFPMSTGLARPFLPQNLPLYFAQTVALPELKTKSEPVRRDSRSYPMPSWGESLDPITMTFILDCYRPGGANASPYRSDIYQTLEVWRAAVRAGRGSMSGEYSFRLNTDYRIDCRFGVGLKMLRGAEPAVPTEAEKEGPEFEGLWNTALFHSQYSVITDLAFSKKFTLVNCWLGSFKMSDLSYDAAKVVLLTATFYADDILQEPELKPFQKPQEAHA